MQIYSVFINWNNRISTLSTYMDNACHFKLQKIIYALELALDKSITT